MAALPVFLLLCLAATGLSEPLHKRIINGNHAELGSHPYIVEFMNGTENHCGGTLISREWVLTAAHCVDEWSERYNTVKLGEHSHRTHNYWEQTMYMSEIYMHPDYNKPNDLGYPNDIALVKLSQPAILGKYVQTAKLAEKGSTFTGQECVVAGWGRTGRGSPDLLQEAKVTQIPNHRCKQHWKKPGSITEKHICVFSDNIPSASRPRTCSGDSGGPMMCGSQHNVLAGVLSFGETNCSAGAASVYTRVSKYRDWIKSHTGF